MYVGHSSSRGIVIGDTAKPEPNAVYGCRRDGVIVIETGSFKELVARQQAEAAPDDKPSEERRSGRLVFGVMGLFLAFSAAVWVLFGFINFLAALVFSVLAYFPVMVILFARRNPYCSDELHQQFRRYHGCEHACIQLLAKKNKAGSGAEPAAQPAGAAGIDTDDAAAAGAVGVSDAADDAAAQSSWLTMSNLVESPIYDSECGTVYAGYFLTLAVEIGLFLSTLVDLGFLWSAGTILVSVILFFILIFMPWNPYKRLQKPAVAQPGEAEYEVGVEILKYMSSTNS